MQVSGKAPILALKLHSHRTLMFLQGESCLCFVTLNGRTACSLLFRLAWALERRQVGFWENHLPGPDAAMLLRFQLECLGQMSSPCSLGSPKEYSCVPTSQGVSWPFRELFPWFHRSDQNQLRRPSWDVFYIALAASRVKSWVDFPEGKSLQISINKKWM